MKKVLLIIGINLLILFSLLAISEFIFYELSKEQYISVLKRFGNQENLDFKYSIKMRNFDEKYEDLKKQLIRKPNGENYTKKSIILFGCSFIYGFGLNIEETVGAKLSEETKRPAYNRGIPGAGVQHMYYQLNRDDFYDEIKKEPEFIIYNLIYQYHYERLFMYTFHLYENDLYLQYDQKDGNIYRRKNILPNYINGLYTVRYIHSIINKQKFHETQIGEDYMFLMLKKSKEIAQKKWPNIRFIVLNFEVENEKNGVPFVLTLVDNFAKRLKDDGFEVYSMKEITGIDYAEPNYRISETDDHPRAEYWQNAVPQIAKKLGLY